MRDVPKLANHLHLPVQSGSDRDPGADEARLHGARVQAEDPPAARRAARTSACPSDFIVGFPGETERDFAATLQLIAEVGFDQSFSFIYSRRPGTPAASLPDDVPRRREAAAARASCRRRSTRRRGRSAARMVGTVQRVLVERPCEARTRASSRARTENNRWVNFDGDPRLIEPFVDVVITEALPNSLRGRLVAPDADAPRELPRDVADGIRACSSRQRADLLEPADNAALANLVRPARREPAADRAAARRRDQPPRQPLPRSPGERPARPPPACCADLYVPRRPAKRSTPERRRTSRCAGSAAWNSRRTPREPAVRRRRRDDTARRGCTSAPAARTSGSYLRTSSTHDLTFGIGPAGTGKTYLAVACAVEALQARARAAHRAGAAGRRGGRAARLPAGRHDAESRSVPAADVRRAVRDDGLRPRGAR